MVPWSIQGAPWGAGEAEGEAEDAAGACAHCGGPVNDARVTLVRHRGEHRIADAFCSVDHLVAWAKSGGRWG